MGIIHLLTLERFNLFLNYMRELLLLEQIERYRK